MYFLNSQATASISNGIIRRKNQCQLDLNTLFTDLPHNYSGKDFQKIFLYLTVQFWDSGAT